MGNAANSERSRALAVALALGYDDPRRAQNLVVDQVAAMELVDHGIGRMSRMRHLVGGLMAVGVKRLADGSHRADAVGLEEIHQRGQHHPDAIDNRFGVGVSSLGGL